MSPGGLHGGERRDEIKGSCVISEDSGLLDPLTIIRWRVSADGLLTQCGHASRRGWREVAGQSLAPEDIRCSVPYYSSGMDGLEAEANAFAANFLIPPLAFKRLLKSAPVSEATILRVAKEIGVAPGIIVGRLQHEGIILFSECNHLKKRFEWASRTRRRPAA